jgi:TRAP-type C4-dicarboxylate transport system substrate-binding protein
VIELPTLFDTAEAGARTIWSLYEEGLVTADYKGLKVLGLFTSAPFGILVVDKNVKNLHDLRGMRIRVSGATVGLSFSRLGLVPLGLTSNLLGRALDSDWIDAMSFGYDTAAGTPTKPPLMVIDQVSTLIDANFSAPAQIVIMNQASFDRLPSDLQQVIDKLSGRDFSLRAGQSRDATDRAAKNQAAKNPKYNFFAFSAADRAEIAERIKPVFDDWAADLARSGIDAPALLKRARELTAQPNT